jgi:hypothetical protein
MRSCQGITVLAGSNNLNNEIHWFYIADAMKDLNATLDWISGKVLVVVTGSNIQGDIVPEICEFLEACHKRGVAGVAINTGDYIRAVPKEAIDLADSLCLPLFNLPWKTRFVDFTRELCSKILSRDSSITTQKFLEDILCNKQNSNLFDIKLACNSFGISPEDDYRVVVLSTDKKGCKLHDLSEFLKKYGEQHQREYLLSPIGSLIVLLIKGSMQTVVIKKWINDALVAFERNNEKTISVSGGAGMVVQGLSKISNSFHCAEKLLECAFLEDRLKAPIDNVLFFEDTDIITFLASLDDTDSMRTFYNSLFRDLLEYDRINNTELMKTLETYISQQAKYLPTANKLFIHVNTLKYRLQKIEELIETDIRSVEGLSTVVLGLKIGQLL